jgi:hypothetical protein
LGRGKSNTTATQFAPCDWCVSTWKCDERSFCGDEWRSRKLDDPDS